MGRIMLFFNFFVITHLFVILWIFLFFLNGLILKLLIVLTFTLLLLLVLTRLFII